MKRSIKNRIIISALFLGSYVVLYSQQLWQLISRGDKEAVQRVELSQNVDEKLRSASCDLVRYDLFTNWLNVEDNDDWNILESNKPERYHFYAIYDHLPPHEMLKCR
jgi:hypothetical protein